VEMLSQADYLVNFLWHVRDEVQERIFNELMAGDSGMPVSDRSMIDKIKWICSKRRTIRDTEDLIWTLRNDPNLPPGISSRREELEERFWDFAQKRQPKMAGLLIKNIQSEMDGGNG